MAEAMGMKNRQQMGVGLVFAWISEGEVGAGDGLMEIRKGWLEREAEPGFRNEEKEGVHRV